MDRQNNVHKVSRVELPGALISLHESVRSELSMPSTTRLAPRPILSKLAASLGRLGIFTCGLVVIATASLLAMLVH